jgi:hypothetical protein
MRVAARRGPRVGDTKFTEASYRQSGADTVGDGPVCIAAGQLM